MLDMLGIPNEIPKGSFYDLSADEEPGSDEDQDEKPKRKRGGQPGNRNARKHGFYSKHFTLDQMKQLEEVDYHKGLDPEIALLRVKLNAMLDNPETSPELILKTVNALTKLISVQRRYIYG